jgi:hypothetical protein
MNVLIQKSAPVKQSGRVCGRGLARRKLSLEQRKGLAADLLTGAREFQPSLTQTASLLGVTPAQVREELHAREELLVRERQEVLAAAANEREQRINALIAAWNGAAESERTAAVRVIGVARVWDVIAAAIS